MGGALTVGLVVYHTIVRVPVPPDTPLPAGGTGAPSRHRISRTKQCTEHSLNLPQVIYRRFPISFKLTAPEIGFIIIRLQQNQKWTYASCFDVLISKSKDVLLPSHIKY